MFSLVPITPILIPNLKYLIEKELSGHKFIAAVCLYYHVLAACNKLTNAEGTNKQCGA